MTQARGLQDFILQIMTFYCGLVRPHLPETAALGCTELAEREMPYTQVVIALLLRKLEDGPFQNTVLHPAGKDLVYANVTPQDVLSRAWLLCS